MKHLMISLSLVFMLSFTTACQQSKEKTESTESSDKAMDENTAEVIYTCSMHPEVESKDPGKCPKCGMELTKKESGEGMEHEHSDSTIHQ